MDGRAERRAGELSPQAEEVPAVKCFFCLFVFFSRRGFRPASPANKIQEATDKATVLDYIAAD